MLDIGTVIATARKQAGITQQAVADFLGVSKASVSKWETGQSYPDITLLPLLASFFDLTVDALLAYSATMSDADTAQLYKRLQAQIAVAPAKAYHEIKATIQRYYACAGVVMSMGTLVLNHADLLPGDRLAYVRQAQGWFAHIPTITDSPTLIDKATKMAAMCDLLLQQPEAVLAKLGATTPEAIPADSLIAGAYQQLGDLPKALTTLQTGLYQNVAIIMSQLTNYLQLTTGDKPRFDATVVRGQAVIAGFAVANLNPIVAVNFWSSAAVGYATQQRTDAVVAQLQALIPVLAALPEPLTLHGDAYFDRVAPWLEATDTAGVTPRNSGHIKVEFAQLLLTHPAMQALPKTAALAPCLAQLKEIGRE